MDQVGEADSAGLIYMIILIPLRTFIQEEIKSFSRLNSRSDPVIKIERMNSVIFWRMGMTTFFAEFFFMILDFSIKNT